jgi:hypothetical protein
LEPPETKNDFNIANNNACATKNEVRIDVFNILRKPIQHRKPQTYIASTNTDIQRFEEYLAQFMHITENYIIYLIHTSIHPSIHLSIKIHLLMYSTISVRNGIQATPQGRRLYRAGVGFELAIKRLPARRRNQ